MRAIEYGIKTFGGYSLMDSLTNIIVFNENITVENPDEVYHLGNKKHFIEYVFENSTFVPKENGDFLTFDEFTYLLDTEIEPIESSYHHLLIDGVYKHKRVFKIGDKYFISILDDGTLDNIDVIAQSTGKKKKKSKPILLNEKLKENKKAIIIFISSNGALIENAFTQIDQIRDNELVFFIEDKQDSNLFGSVVRIASGKTFGSIYQVPFKEISKVVNVYENSIRPVDFEYMLKDHFKNKISTVYLVKRVFLGLLSEVIIIKDDMALSTIEFLSEQLVKGINYLTFEKTRWQYYDENGVKNQYNNILIPIEALETKKIDKDNLKIYSQQLKEIEKHIEFAFKRFGDDIIFKNKIFKKIINKIYDVLDTIEDFINNPFEKGLDITKSTLIFYNALIIGIINGFIEAIKGFFTLIAQLTKGLKFAKDEVKKGHLINQWVMFFESIENFYDLMTNFITKENMVSLIGFCKKCLLITPLIPYMTMHYMLDENFSITSDRMGYYLGFAIGTVFQMIVEVLLTGGAKTMADAAKLLFSQLSNLFKGLSKTTVRATENVIEGIIIIFAKLKHIAKNFPQFLDEVFELILKWLAKLEDFISIFGKETLALFSKHGVDIRKITQPVLASGIPLPVGNNVYVLMREGREIFRGSKAEVDDFANQLKKMSDAEAQKFLDDLVKGNKLKLAEKMWEKYTYLDFTAKPPVKPCFLAGTLIHTTKGLEPIENIIIGTEVYCYDEIKQVLTTQKVSETYKNQTDKYLRITTQSGEILEVTGQHLFYQKGSQTWIKAHQLKLGMKLYNAQDNNLEIISTIDIIEQNVPTYNFEVPIHHNYLVGKTALLAHNANKFRSIIDITTRKYAFYQLYTQVLEGNIAEITTQYIGKTTREDLDIRNSEHKYTAEKKGPNSKHYWKFDLKPQIANLHKGALEFIEMADIQSSVWEKYFIELKSQEIGKPLRNIQNPISEKRFNALKASKKHKNTCLFFI